MNKNTALWVGLASASVCVTLIHIHYRVAFVQNTCRALFIMIQIDWRSRNKNFKFTIIQTRSEAEKNITLIRRE